VTQSGHATDPLFGHLVGSRSGSTDQKRLNGVMPPLAQEKKCRSPGSTIKLRQAGFIKTIDTEDSFRNALQSLIDHMLLPPAAK
jgi:hypothetical protein